MSAQKFLALPYEIGIEANDGPSSLKIEFPKLNNHDLFIVLEVTDVKRYEELYDVKILSAEGNIGWLYIGGLYTYPALRYEGHLASIDINEQFVVLEVKRGDLKVLTTQGIVGWVTIDPAALRLRK